MDVSSGHSWICTTWRHLKLDSSLRWNGCVGWKVAERERQQDCQKQHTSSQNMKFVILKRNLQVSVIRFNTIRLPSIWVELSPSCAFSWAHWPNGLTLGLKIFDTRKEVMSKSDDALRKKKHEQPVETLTTGFLLTWFSKWGAWGGSSTEIVHYKSSKSTELSALQELTLCSFTHNALNQQWQQQKKSSPWCHEGQKNVKLGFDALIWEFLTWNPLTDPPFLLLL